MTLIGLPLAPSKPISFSDSNASTVHFSHNDALIITVLIGNCRAFKVLVKGGSFVNILYGGALDRMEDTPRTTQVMIVKNILICIGLTRMRRAPQVLARSQFTRPLQHHHKILRDGY